MFGKRFIVTGWLAAVSIIRASGQTQPMPPMPGMPGLDHGDAQPPPPVGSMNMVEMNAASMFLMNLASGTSSNPAYWQMPMVMKQFGSWNRTDFGPTTLHSIGSGKLTSSSWI